MIVSSDRQSETGDKIPHKVFQVPFKHGYLEEKLIRPALEENKHLVVWNAFKLHFTICECLLNNTGLLEEIKNFDLIVYDSFAPCAVLVSQLLHLPNVAIAIAPPNYAFSIYFMVPMPLSYIPIPETGFPGNMTLFQRVANVAFYCLQNVLLEILFVRSLEAIMAKYNISSERSFKEGYGDAELVIFLADFAIENPQPLLPGWLSFANTSF